MKTLHRIAEARAAVAAWRVEGARVALVPTMGHLHAGHLALVARARELAERVVVSIFVNPLQFGPAEDFDAYPRTLAEDAAKLEGLADLLFAPAESEIYPHGREAVTYVEVPDLSSILCGVERPIHFRGVATVVTKLLNIVQPDVALFGEKDFQQLMVIRRLTADLNLPVEIVGLPTVREADGLAMSSRNSYLDEAARRTAPELQRTLQAVAARLREGASDYAALEREASARLEAAGFVPDYVAIRRRADLEAPAADEMALVVLAAARLGGARLIDNLACERGEGR